MTRPTPTLDNAINEAQALMRFTELAAYHASLAAQIESVPDGYFDGLAAIMRRASDLLEPFVGTLPAAVARFAADSVAVGSERAPEGGVR